MRFTPTPPREINWPALRKAFIERPERAAYAELGAEFNVSEVRIRRAACDEGWATLRAAHLEARLKEGDAAVAILQAAKVDGAVIRAFGDVALEVIRKVHEVVQQVESKKSVNTRANTLNTCSFTLSNLANALHRIGVVGLPKQLKDAAGEANGRWNPQMLTALNVTVQNLVGAQRGTQPDSAPSVAISGVSL